MNLVTAMGRWVAPWLSVGDLIMARRQLLNLKRLAERPGTAVLQKPHQLPLALTTTQRRIIQAFDGALETNTTTESPPEIRLPAAQAMPHDQIIHHPSKQRTAFTHCVYCLNQYHTRHG
jgi:hypothetical protein